ncbi:MAG: DUF333 domain-containing protein [Pseudobdellovibrio sp.]
MNAKTYLLTFIYFFSSISFANSPTAKVSATTNKTAPAGNTNKAIPNAKTESTVKVYEIDSKSTTPPKIKAGEYSIFLDETYKIFKTKIFNHLELTENCFKTGKPSCIAFETSEITPKTSALQTAGGGSVAAANCTNLGGKNYIAIASNNDQSSFCRFNDSSMITSWSLYTKHSPVPTTK